MLTGISLAAAQESALPNIEDPLSADTTSGFLAGSLLPDGSILKNVVLPSYDEQLHLAASLRARELTIVNRRLIEGRDLVIRFFNPDRSPRGTIEMAKARYDDRKRLLSAREPVTLESDDLIAKGTGLDYDVTHNRGVLHGPVSAEIPADLSTSMNTSPPRHGSAAGAMLMASMLAVPAQSDPDLTARIAEVELGPEQLARISADAAPVGGKVEKEALSVDEEWGSLSAASAAADAAMNTFFKIASLPPLLADGAAESDDVPAPEIKADPLRTRITADDRAFFDASGGLLVFLKNIVVRDPRIDLTATDELKVFFDPKPEAEAKVEEVAADGEGKKEVLLSGAKFGDPSRIVATGVVVIDYKPADSKNAPVKASARTVVYDLKKEEIILRGGSPWIIRDGEPFRLSGADAYIRIRKDGTIVTGNGRIDTEINTQRKR